jgi:hypothetical protein
LQEGPPPLDYSCFHHQTSDSVAGDLRQTLARQRWSTAFCRTHHVGLPPSL